MKEIPLSTGTKVLCWVIVLQALDAFISLVFFPTQTDQFFAWKINPPINAVLLGLLYPSTVIFLSQAAIRGRWETLRYLIPTLLYSTIMLTIATFLHFDKFNTGVLLYLWVGTYIIVPLLLIWVYWRYQRQSATWEVIGRPVRAPTRILALTIGVILLSASLTALIWPGLITARAPWPMAPLIVRAFASIWGAFSIGLLWFAREKDWERLYPVADLVTLMPAFWLVAIAVYPHGPDVTFHSMLPLLAALTFVLLSGLALRLLQRKV